MAVSREIGGATAGLGVATARLSITDVPALTGQSPGFPFDIPPLTNSNAPFATQFLTLSSGFNQINVPANASAVYLCPPASNAVAWTIKGPTGDTGIIMNLLGWAFLPLAPAQTTVGITAGSSLVGFFIAWF